MHADKLPITGPCPIDLDAIGFDRSAKVAHCSHCVKNVTVLSNMTRGEARAFLHEHKGQKLCVSYARDADGHVRFQPEVTPAPEVMREPALVPVTRLRARVGERSPGRSARAAGFVAVLGVSAALAACAPHGDPPRDPTPVTARPTPEPPKPIVVDPRPDLIPMAGAMAIPEEIPEEIMVEGEMAVPEPEGLGLDEPCDGKKTPAEPAKGREMQAL